MTDATLTPAKIAERDPRDPRESIESAAFTASQNARDAMFDLMLTYKYGGIDTAQRAINKLTKAADSLRAALGDEAAA